MKKTGTLRNRSCTAPSLGNQFEWHKKLDRLSIYAIRISSTPPFFSPFRIEDQNFELLHAFYISGLFCFSTSLNFYMLINIHILQKRGCIFQKHYVAKFLKLKKAARFAYLTARKSFFNSKNTMSSIKLDFLGLKKSPLKTAGSLDFTGFASMSSILITHPSLI